jgi:hypothetical protein
MKENSQEKLVQQSTVSGPIGKDTKSGDWWIKIVSAATAVYLIFSLISPIFLKEDQRPRKIEKPDLVLIALVFLFSSGLLNRLEDFGISKDGGITARFKELKEEVDEQKKQIDDLQAEQLEQLERQQQNLVATQESLEQTQAFMYNFLLGEKDYEKIDQLDKHSERKTSYTFYVSGRVGDELRRLRDLKLIATRSGYVSDVVRASDYGKRSIDLTKYFVVTDLGKKYLVTRETLQSKNQQEVENSEEVSKA